MSGMAMTAEVPVIVDLERYGNKGWTFTAIWSPGQPGECHRQYRTKGYGLWFKLFRKEETWRKVRWISPEYRWPQNKAQMEKQIRIVFRSTNHYDWWKR